ncbi:MAG: NAD+ synthase [Chloroflexi bacterium]|nr:MAG: NAD+ synthase [Chloroflexota bacterium]MBL1195703.1 NAD+ synthase [Chloroflexota bacterium]NOH12991.1 NAD+ synthase [Chloroflexota bacterium]
MNTIDLNLNPELATKVLAGFIRKELGRADFSKAVLGLSGGIDSALSCFLAAEALGPENVLAVRMPYKSSSQGSLDHAQLVIEQLGVQSLTVEITEMVEPLFEKMPDMDNMRKGNVMARQRMIILYDQSEAFNGLVVGTGNKTEILLGYSTLYGDAACAINPIGDLYKTQVRQLSHALGVPDEIVNKAPSADLWAGQTDEDELGYTYEEADNLLYLIVDQRYTPQECVEAGFGEDFVQGVVRRMMRNHFKRVMPPIAKVSNRTIGYDFLYPRDWGT